ncbi:hypothetical protein, partial [Wenzhouxiangella sp. XN79A]|uniref:hypothetical protein n=1 Tax=Wenzhouxiangella sp. XN79A TaxID=2724193 RepID=UPI001980DC77
MIATRSSKPPGSPSGRAALARAMACFERRVAEPVREQAPSNRRIKVGRGFFLLEAACGRRVAGSVRAQAPLQQTDQRRRQIEGLLEAACGR